MIRSRLLPCVYTDIGFPSGLDKNGNLKSLAFPVFHSEILTQSWWSASQDLGRVKVVISEGYARGQPEMPFQRVKNVVVFSFQHAPQGESVRWIADLNILIPSLCFIS